MKKFIFAAILGLVAQVSFGQSFWRPLDRPTPSSVMKVSILDSTTTPLPDSSFTGPRPQGPMFMYGFPGNFAFAAIGVGIEHDTYSSTTGAWTEVWEAGLMAGEGGIFAPSSLTATTIFGAQGAFLNKRLTIGVGDNIAAPKGRHLFFGVGTAFTIFNVN